MGLFVGGRAVKSMILDGRNASQAYLGTILVWDGTSPAFVSAVRAIIGAYLADPAVTADSAVAAPPVLAAGLARDPAVRATATPTAQRAFAAASMGGSTVTADATIAIETATASARAISPLSDADIAAPAALAAATILTPAVRTPGSVIALPVTATAAFTNPALTASSVIAAPTATASALGSNPTVQRGASTAAAKATATAATKNPAVTATNITSMSMNKSGAQSPDIGDSTWTELTSFTADSSYPDTVLSGANKLVANGAGTVTISASVGWTSQSGSYSRDIRVLINGTLVWARGAQTQGAGAVSSGTFTATVAAGDVISLEAWTSSVSTRRGIVAANTFLRYTV